MSKLQFYLIFFIYLEIITLTKKHYLRVSVFVLVWLFLTYIFAWINVGQDYALDQVINSIKPLCTILFLFVYLGLGILRTISKIMFFKHNDSYIFTNNFLDIVNLYQDWESGEWAEEE